MLVQKHKREQYRDAKRGGYSSKQRYRSCKGSEKGDWEAIVVLPVVAVAAKV